MTTIKCKVEQCGYMNNGFCGNPLLTIDENGCCGQLYYKGQLRADALDPRRVGQRLEIIIGEEGEKKNDDSVD